MLKSRVIASLLILEGSIYKTTKFSDKKYVGDPINAVRIFNEMQVDELVILDFGATVNNKAPDLNLISKLADECRMPLCYGGGIKNFEQASDIIQAGVEKVCISSEAIRNPNLIKSLAQKLGSQSVVVAIDYRREPNTGVREVYTHRGLVKTGFSISSVTDFAQQNGAGEIFLTSIDDEGERCGYDHGAVVEIRNSCNLPITINGGAGSYEDLRALVGEFHPVGAAAGTIFVFKGKFKAPLISYPTKEQKKDIVQL